MRAAELIVLDQLLFDRAAADSSVRAGGRVAEYSLCLTSFAGTDHFIELEVAHHSPR